MFKNLLKIAKYTILMIFSALFKQADAMTTLDSLLMWMCLYNIFAIGKMPVYKHLGKNSKTEEQKKEEQKKKEEEEVSKKRREEMDAEIQKKVRVYIMFTVMLRRF